MQTVTLSKQTVSTGEVDEILIQQYEGADEGDKLVSSYTVEGGKYNIESFSTKYRYPLESEWYYKKGFTVTVNGKAILEDCDIIGHSIVVMAKHRTRLVLRTKEKLSK